MSAASYSFVSRWRVPAGPDRCWAETERMLRPGAASWWPGVRVAEAPQRLAAGEPLVLAVRSPFGYRLRVRLTLVEVDAPLVLAATSRGDLEGSGRVLVTPDAVGGAVVTFHWDVTTRRRWMNVTAPVLRPVFALAHAAVMRAGERGFRRALTR